MFLVATLCFNRYISEMNPRIRIHSDLIFADKPAGLTTHQSSPELWGFIEYLQAFLGQTLYAIHRLDQTTTGCIAFATSKEAAAKYSAFFLNHEVFKKYLFVTDKDQYVNEDYFLHRSLIVQEGKKHFSNPKEIPNSETEFRRVKRSPFYSLWSAFPKSGKAHQIRLHAKDIGLNILGDPLYGGTSFPHLCLHAAELKLPELPLWQTSAPVFFERLGQFRDPDLIRFLASMDRRERLFQFLSNPEQCQRLVHHEFEEKIRMDQFGEYLWIYDYEQKPLSLRDAERLKFLSRFSRKKILVRTMNDRGTNPNENKLKIIHSDYSKDLDIPTPIPDTWTATESFQEYKAEFVFKSKVGLSPGLFLDQRCNRSFVFKNSKNKRLLNLFSYTCGFSLAAALGQAKTVTSVDLSKTFLEWGKENFKQNGLNPDNPSYPFIKMDSLLYLKKCEKHGQKFDLIVCDPPSFSRNDKGKTFKIDKDYKSLVSSCLALLDQGGLLLFSTNYEKWDQNQFQKNLLKLLKELGLGSKFKQLELTDFAVDFELPMHEKLLKFIWLRRIP